MRVFAGPNGSGKTTIFKGILADNQIQLGVYVNADEIEQILQQIGKLDFTEFGLHVDEEELKSFFHHSTFSPVKRNEPDLFQKIQLVNDVLTTTATIDSYLAADLAEFIRQQLVENEHSFTYETVMSHPDKILFLTRALQRGYKVYLYYIATEDPEINISRVNVRVAKDGHAVHPDVIRSRYYKSLKNLHAAVKQTTRAYIFDNSQRQANLIAEINNGTDVALNTAIELPNWVAEYLLNQPESNL